MGDLRRTASAEGARAWQFLSEGFACTPAQRRKPASWEGCNTIVAAYEPLLRARHAQLLRELEVDALDGELAELGGDPLRDDWRSFPPPSLGREEGWSDWLAHVLATGDTDFLVGLFAITGLPAAAPKVRREEVLYLDATDISKGHYRSDILVEWTGLAVHVEVKIGDPHLQKTWNEAEHLRRTHGGTWHHFLLVLHAQKPEADRLKREMEPPTGTSPPVTVITWEDVERELRRALARRSTPRSWRGLARAFTGALGQLHLRRPILDSVNGESGGA